MYAKQMNTASPRVNPQGGQLKIHLVYNIKLFIFLGKLLVS